MHVHRKNVKDSQVLIDMQEPQDLYKFSYVKWPISVKGNEHGFKTWKRAWFSVYTGFE